MLAVFPQNQAGREKILPPSDPAPESLVASGSFRVKCSHIIPGISAYSHAVFYALRPRRKPRSNTVCGHPGERPCRRPGKAGFPGRGHRKAGPPPAPDQQAKPPPGSSGTMRLSSISPTYSRGSPTASSRSPYHSWLTGILPACGSPAFPRGSAHGPNRHLLSFALPSNSR